MRLNPACCLNCSLLKMSLSFATEACADFWRRHCYPLQREIAGSGTCVVERPLRSFCAPLSAICRGRPRSLNLHRLRMKRWPRAMKIVAKIAAVKQKWIESVGGSTPLSKTPGSTGASLTIGNQEMDR